jgi:hypothetical protein
LPSIYSTGIAGRARFDFSGAYVNCRIAPAAM